MKKNLYTLFLIMVTILTILTGCGGGGGDSPASGGTGGSVDGYAHANGSTISITSSQTPPNGYAALAGATITVSGTTATTTTGANGHFRVDNVPVGSQTVTVAKAGLTSATFSVSVTSGQTTTTFTPTTNSVFRDLTNGTAISLADWQGKAAYFTYYWQSRTSQGNYVPSPPTAAVSLATTSVGSGYFQKNVSAAKLRPANAPLPGKYKPGQISIDNIARKKEAELLSRRIQQKRPSAKYNAATYQVGDTWNNINIFTTNDQTTQTSAICVKITPSAYFFIDTADDTPELRTRIDNLSAAWESIYSTDKAKFGNENDVDGNGKVIILFSHHVQLMGALGYFYSLDKYDEAGSNRADIFYITDNTQYSDDTILGTLAHEFQHMIYFDEHYNRQAVNTYSWLNEGLSMLAEYYNGYTENRNSWLGHFLRYPQQVSLTYWTSQNYGSSGLFVHYLHEQFGNTAIRQIVQTGQVGIQAVESATGRNFDTIYQDFTRALFLSNTGLSTDPRYNFTGINLQQLQPLGRKGLYPYETITPGTTKNYTLMPYQLVLFQASGSIGNATLTGTSAFGTAFGVTN